MQAARQVTRQLVARGFTTSARRSNLREPLSTDKTFGSVPEAGAYRSVQNFQGALNQEWEAWAHVKKPQDKVVNAGIYTVAPAVFALGAVPVFLRMIGLF